MVNRLGYTDRGTNFTEQEMQALKRFVAFLSTNHTLLFRGERMPPIAAALIKLNIDGTKSTPEGMETSIFIRGLQSKDEIMAFRSVVSQRAIRKIYSNLRLSYSSVRATAAIRLISIRELEY
ncbi:hypothetical protein OQA88_1855 [Cercophora sp. LCS_1]